MEQLPDTIIVCNGGEPAAVGVPLPFKTITVTLLDGVDLTSRTLATSGGQVWTEAPAAVDEPSPENQQACEAPDGRCAGKGVGTGMGAYLGRLVFSRSAVSFTIPWADPGTLTSRIVRLTISA